MANTDQTGESAAEPYDSRRRRRGTGSRIRRAIAALVMAAIVGAIAAVAAAELGYAGPAFLLAFVATAAYLYAKPVPSAALGSGFYLAALAVLLTPALYLLPEIVGDGAVDEVSEATPIADDLLEAARDGAAAAGAAVDETPSLFATGVDAAEEAAGEPLGLAAWALAFVALAAVLAALGYLAKRRARRARERDEWTRPPERRAPLQGSDRTQPRSDGGRPRSERERSRHRPVADRRPGRSESRRRRRSEPERSRRSEPGRSRGRSEPSRRRPRSDRDRRRFVDEPRRR